MQKGRVYDLIKGPKDNNMTIGFGSYGTVKLARVRDTNEIVAMKIMHNKNAKEEIEVQKRLKHPNIIRLLDYYYDKQKNVTYMVLEYAENGTLFERIKQTRMDKALIRRLFKEVCSAVGFLHQNGYMHRDIKPENILLNKKNQAKLCDFGFAAETQAPRRTICGTYEYMSPEMILKEPYTNKNDIWSLGILLFQMIEGNAPFRGETMEDVFKSMKQQIYFSERFTKLEINFIRDILKVNPKNRPEISQMLNHPYFVEQGSSSKMTKSTNSSEEEAMISSLNKIKLIGVNKAKSNNDMSLQEPPRVDRDPQRPPMSHPIASYMPQVPNTQYCPPPPQYQYYQPMPPAEYLQQHQQQQLGGPQQQNKYGQQQQGQMFPTSPHNPYPDPYNKSKISLKRFSRAREKMGCTNGNPINVRYKLSTSLTTFNVEYSPDLPELGFSDLVTAPSNGVEMYMYGLSPNTPNYDSYRQPRSTYPT